MADAASLSPRHAIAGALPVRRISTDDLVTAVRKGIDDFQEMPTHAVFLGVFYIVIGFVLFQTTFYQDLPQLAFPLIAGFALLGPFAALGMYELSRRRERGMDTSRWRMFSVVTAPAAGSILLLGIALAVLFVIWVRAALEIFHLTMGTMPGTFTGFMAALFTTPGGWAMILIGNAVGALFAALVFALTVVSFPLLLDRNCGVGTAVATSLAAIAANPRPMLLWGLFIAGSFFVGCLPFLIGIAIVFPILGHASWHLYRAVVPE